ncbi:S-adenosyl-L-methionine-dependent methyltransferase [Paxillus ammoniavirescens]|nr:S-adenosyl-L-methionine-dependent methyltransferase [Paxillus ammoniavirescens]
MATFGKATFDTAIYAASRPTYPRALFEYVFRFHGSTGAARWVTAVDLGCGTGQATVELTPFKKVIGADPSAGMVESARKALKSNDIQKGQVEYVQSPAEKLDFLESESVDLMIAAQAGHWFDWSKMWHEAARVLRKDGTAAIWNYSEFRFPRYPTFAPQITQFFQGTDPLNSVGPYWQQPGRSILDNHLIAVPNAEEAVPGAFKDFTRCYFTGTHHPHLPSPQPILMRKTMTWNNLYDYLRTCSALHTFLEKNPQDKLQPEGDICMRFWKSLMRNAEEQDGVKVGAEDNVDVEWPLAVVMVKKA